MIDIGTSIFDDRRKDDGILVVESVLWSDERYALVRVVHLLVTSSGDIYSPEDEPILIDLHTGSVMNESYQFWTTRSLP
jgi:hypothetical protein